MLCCCPNGDDDREAWLGDAKRAARAIEEGGSLEGVPSVPKEGVPSVPREEGGRPGPSIRLDEVGVGGCWGEEANCLGGAIVAGGGVDGVEGVAVVTTGGVHTPPGAWEEDMLEATEANGEKAPKGKRACSLGSAGENG